MHAPRRLLPAAVVFSLVLAGHASILSAQALDSASADVADAAVGADAEVAAAAPADQTPPPAPTQVELLAASALPTGVVEIRAHGQDLPVPLNQRVLSYVEL